VFVELISSGCLWSSSPVDVSLAVVLDNGDRLRTQNAVFAVSFKHARWTETRELIKKWLANCL
jgi:hypothetical protein